MADVNENVDKEEFDIPSYACDEKTKDGFIHVIVWARGLKTSSDIVFKGMIPKRIKKPSNAKIDVKFGNMSVCVTVYGESGDMKWKKMRLKVDKLLQEIIADQSYYEVDNERVLLYMRKKEDRSWFPAMKHGIEAEDSDDESS